MAFGRDTLIGAGDQDIFVGGRFLYEDDSAALRTIMAYWNSNPTDSTSAWYTSRVVTLRDIGVGEKGIRLSSATTVDDNALDVLYAAQGITNPH